MSESVHWRDFIEASYQIDKRDGSELDRKAYVTKEQVEAMAASVVRGEDPAIIINDLDAIKNGRLHNIMGFALVYDGTPPAAALVYRHVGIDFEYRLTPRRITSIRKEDEA